MKKQKKRNGLFKKVYFCFLFLDQTNFVFWLIEKYFLRNFFLFLEYLVKNEEIKIWYFFVSFFKKIHFRYLLLHSTNSMFRTQNNTLFEEFLFVCFWIRLISCLEFFLFLKYLVKDEEIKMKKLIFFSFGNPICHLFFWIRLIPCLGPLIQESTFLRIFYLF